VELLQMVLVGHVTPANSRAEK